MKSRVRLNDGLTEVGGVELLGVMIAGVIGMGIMYAFMAMFQHAQQAERGIASNAELARIGTNLSMIFNTPQSCAKSGLVGLVVDPANPSATSVTIHFPGAAGPGRVFLKEGELIEDTRKATSVRFAEMASIGTRGGNNVYFSTLETVTAVVGKAMTVREPSNTTRLNLVLDAGNHVLECFQDGEAAVVASTPAPTPSTPTTPSTPPTPTSGGAEFGGMYILATASACPSNPNPLTGSTSCPRGFRAAFVGGVLCSPRDPATRKLYMCYK